MRSQKETQDIIQTNSRRIAKNTLVLYFRMLFLMVITLFTSRVILHALGITDYGIYNVVGGFVSMFSLMSATLTSACTRFINYEMGSGNKENLRNVFSTTVTIQYFIAAIIAVFAEIVGLWYVNNIMVFPLDRLFAANWCLQFSIITFCANLITVPYNACIVAHEKMKAFAYVSLVDGIIKLLICYLVMIPPFDKLVYYALLLCIEQFGIRIAYQRYCKNNFEECKYRFFIDKVLLKKIFSYSGWNIIGSSSAVLKNQGVNLIINLFFGPALNAAKGVSGQVLNAVTAFSNNFMMALNPQITQSYAAGNLDYMFSLIYKGSRYSYYMIMILSLPIIINANYILHLWLNEVPPYTVIFCQVSLFASMISSLSKTIITAQNATGNVRNYQLIVGGMQMLDLPLCYIWLILGGEPYSIVVVTLLVEILCLFARLYMIRYTIPEFNANNYMKKVIFNVIAVNLFAIAIPLYLCFLLNESFFSFFVVTIVCLTCSIVSIGFIGMQKSERMVIVRSGKKLYLKVKK